MTDTTSTRNKTLAVLESNGLFARDLRDFSLVLISRLMRQWLVASLPEAILNYSEDEERWELIGRFILRTIEDDGQHPYLNEELREEIWTAAANLLRKTEQGGVFRSKITIYCTGVQDGTWIQR